MKEKKVFNPELDELKKGKDSSLIRYTGAIPQILLYQIITKTLLVIVAAGLKGIISKLIHVIGIQAITNMDIPYLFQSWQGLIILLIGFVILCLYVMIDINCMIIISDSVLHQKKKGIIKIIKETITGFRYMFHPKGIFVVLYVAILSPLCSGMYNISLTESFYIPDFIMSVIYKNKLFFIPYCIVIAILVFLGFIYLFTFHFMILRKENVSVAMHTSRVTIKKYWSNFLKRYLLFLVKCGIVTILLFVVFAVLPFGITYAFFKSSTYLDGILTFDYLQVAVVLTFIRYLFPAFQIMEITRIYESYTLEDEGELIAPKHSLHIKFWLITLCGYAFIILLSIGVNVTDVFDTLFPLSTPTDIVAHRAGGNLGTENTVQGLNEAINQGVYGGEIDIQRTKDGYYIVNHDDTFARLAGVNKTSSELTLKECKDLKLPDAINLGQYTQFSTLEEMLDASKDKIHLYVELKGATADSQMAEDVYNMLVERNMVDQVTVISLKYNLISELETNHPEVNTGYLCFVSLGDVTTLNCDELLLEDELYSDDIALEAHEANKKVYIWTVDTDDGIQAHLQDDCDGIITDEVALANNIEKQLVKRDKFSRVIDQIYIRLM